MPQTARMRTVGVEEELLLVDGVTGQPLAVADAVLRRAEAGERGERAATDNSADGPGGRLEHELQQQQLETDTVPQTDLSLLAAELRGWRARADRAAAASGPGWPRSRPRRCRWTPSHGTSPTATRRWPSGSA